MKLKFLKALFFISFLLFNIGCKKESKELTTVNFHLFNPVTGEGYAGVKVSILQDKRKGSGLNITQETETVWQGVTDANGNATYSFKCYNNDKYSYWQTIEKSFYFDTNNDFLIQPEFQPLDKNEVNEVIYKVVKNNVTMVQWYKNLNCFDANDKMRFRSKSIIDVFDNWSIWVPGAPGPEDTFFEGCYEDLYTHTHTQDIWDVEMEVTKNGNTILIRDTFYITGQNGTDTLKLFY